MSEVDEIPPVEALSASLVCAIDLVASKCPEAVPHITRVLKALALIQLDMAQFKTPKQQKLEQMTLLEKRLAACDAGERKKYIMGCLELPESTYHDYRKILINRKAIPDDSELFGVANENNRSD